MNTFTLRLLAAAGLLGLVGLILIYRSQTAMDQVIEPHSREVIEKAKSR